MTQWRKYPRHLTWLFIGTEVNFNFAKNPLEIVGERSLTPPGIQAVAARFSNQENSEMGRQSFFSMDTDYQGMFNYELYV
ncbi:hypothetical protein Gogos_018277, partial [Gossypium gossypioides]|nr:hypothetical protein [Gossypium gossypioides]